MNQSNEKQIWNDHFLQESVKKNYNEAPDGPVSKEAVWQRINSELTEDSSRKHSRFINTKVLSVACVFLILVISSMFFQLKGGEAFGWFTDYFIRDQGKSTQIINQLSDKEITTDNLPPLPNRDDLEVKELIPIEEKMSLTEANATVSFTLLNPTVVPEGYTLKDVTVITFADYPKEKAFLTYEGAESEFTIHQEPIVGEQYSSNITVNNKHAIVETININGSDATYLGFSNGKAELIWLRMRTLITIKGELSLSDMKKVAASLN
ncbi:hypothetical protein GCM10011351_28600 [Paraliobacillus quinghaiensis]|uniref:DUF4367 domain-containing protein n=1 Tax=Paraliobacillus quinghaiensis TaxID=470815 RepID=A0A917TWH3_9BACI|nr:DUF4367 domain-containing protein [Paraliobacillus quinghaiensis]GGM40695.1 hypothetical protein GCM10011351_28600 [Paraliobacillus quinghaiensis]